MEQQSQEMSQVLVSDREVQKSLDEKERARKFKELMDFSKYGLGSESSESEDQKAEEEEVDDLEKYRFYNCPTCEWKCKEREEFRNHLKNHSTHSTPDVSQILNQLETQIDSSQKQRHLNFAANQRNKN